MLLEIGKTYQELAHDHGAIPRKAKVIIIAKTEEGYIGRAVEGDYHGWLFEYDSNGRQITYPSWQIIREDFSLKVGQTYFATHKDGSTAGKIKIVAHSPIDKCFIGKHSNGTLHIITDSGNIYRNEDKRAWWGELTGCAKEE